MDFEHPLAQQLNTLLNDSEGVQLFHQFLSSKFSSGHLLDFWFACKGFRSIIDGDDQLKLLQVAKAIYRTYIKTGATSSVPVNDSTKREIRSVLAAFSHSHHKEINGEKRLPSFRSLFDVAQADVQNLLARSYFLKFLHSDAFKLIPPSSATIECVTRKSVLPGFSGCSDPLDAQNNGNFISKGRLQGERQLVLQSSDDTLPATAETNSYPDSALQADASKSSLCFNVGQNNLALSGGAYLDKSVTTSRRAIEKNGEVVTASELIAYMTLTSELQKSSGPQLSATGGNTNGSTNANNSKVLVSTDARKPGTNLAELDPSAFAQTLSHRLEKVKESRGKMANLLSRMQPTESCNDSNPTQIVYDAPSDSMLAPMLPTSEVQAPQHPPIPFLHSRISSRRRASNPRYLSPSPLQNSSGLLRRKLSTLVCDEVEDAQVILEDHCSRIWTDETEHKLGEADADCSRASRGVLNICPPPQLTRKGRHHNHHNRPSSHRADVYSVSSFDSGVVTCGGLNSSDNESCVSRHRTRCHTTTASYQKHCFHDLLPEECRWNPQVCSFCRRPSMNSTPAPLRKEASSPLTPQPASGYQWSGQYLSSQYPEGVPARGMRSRSLTSDSPSVFDSGMSSTYDHLPVTRCSRQDQFSTKAALETPCTPTVGSFGKSINRDYLVNQQLTNEADLSGLTASTNLPPELMPIGRLHSIPPRIEKPLSIAGDWLTSAFRMVTPSASSGPSNLVVGYYLCDDPVPYRTVWTGSDASVTSSSTSITLGQFKQLVAKKGVYRYFFKTASDDFGTGVVNEEIGDDNAILPLWEGKVIARVERAD